MWPAECFPALCFVEICLPQSKWKPKSKIKLEMLNWSDKMKTWDLLKSFVFGLSLGIPYGKNGSSILSTILSCAPLAFAVFHHWQSLWNIFPQIPRSAVLAKSSFCFGSFSSFNWRLSSHKPIPTIFTAIYLEQSSGYLSYRKFQVFICLVMFLFLHLLHFL
jgi:hypothetical protein